MSLEEIAEKLNAEKVPTIHGTNKWTAASVRKAFVSFLEPGRARPFGLNRSRDRLPFHSGVAHCA